MGKLQRRNRCAPPKINRIHFQETAIDEILEEAAFSSFFNLFEIDDEAINILVRLFDCLRYFVLSRRFNDDYQVPSWVFLNKMRFYQLGDGL